MCTAHIGERNVFEKITLKCKGSKDMTVLNLGLFWPGGPKYGIRGMDLIYCFDPIPDADSESGIRI